MKALLVGIFALLSLCGQQYDAAIDRPAQYDGSEEEAGDSFAEVPPPPAPTAVATFVPSTSGPELLDSELVINSITMDTLVFCSAAGISGTDWVCDEGGTFSEVDTGDSPSLVDGVPYVGASKAVEFAASGKVYEGGDVGDIGTDDFCLEFSIRNMSAAGTARVFGQLDSGNAGWSVKLEGGPLLRVDVAGASLSDQLTAGSVWTSHAWDIIMVCADRDENSTNGVKFYQSGVAIGVGDNMSAMVAEGISNSENLVIGALTQTTSYIQKMGGTTGAIGHVAAWKCTDCMPGGADNATAWAAVAKTRATKFMGLHLDSVGAGGAEQPATVTVGHVNYLDTCNDAGKKVLHRVGANYGRIVERPDSGGDPFVGLLYENAQRRNIFLQNSVFGTSWTAGDVTVNTNAAAAPTNETAGDGLAGDANENDHQVSQAVTLTATNHVVSVFAKAGSESWLYIENQTVSDAFAYFDLDTCEIGTVGAGVNEALADGDWTGDWCRASFSFVGTAAAHTIEFTVAEADADKAVAGDGSTSQIYLWGAQVEIGNFPTTPIDTTTAAVTKGAEVVKWSPTGVVSEIKGSGGCQFLIPDYDAQFSPSMIWRADDIVGHSYGNHSILLRNETTDDKINLVIRNDSAEQSDHVQGSGFDADYSASDGAVHTLYADWTESVSTLHYDGVTTPDGPIAYAGDGFPTGLTQVEIAGGVGIVGACSWYDVPGVRE